MPLPRVLAHVDELHNLIACSCKQEIEFTYISLLPILAFVQVLGIALVLHYCGLHCDLGIVN